MAYREIAPPAALRRHVECAWSLTTGGGIAGHRVPPDGCLDIVYSREEGLRAVGTMTVEQRFDYGADATIVGVRFRPGMAGQFLGAAPEELTDATVPLEDIWGRAGRALAGQLEDARDAASLILGQLRQPVGPPGPVQRAIEAIAAAHGNVDLENIARQANLSPRQFRRRCLEESGLTPKHLCRVLRFRYACSRAARQTDWADIAADAGYFDQAHLIRDFREFTRQTPVAVFSNTRVAAAG